MIEQQSILENFVNKHQIETTDADLQLVRRLDWRFLLPYPELGKVAYWGRENGTIVKALEKFSHSLTLIDQLNETELLSLPTDFDLIVIRNPLIDQIATASEWLRPEGYLYCEVDQNLLATLIKNNRLNITNYHPVLRSFGLTEIAIYWHRPSFEHCIEIIPLNDRDAINYVVTRNHSKLSGRAKLMLAKFLAEIKILNYLVPSVSIISRKR